MVDDRGFEIPIYDPQGTRIYRRTPILSDPPRYCALLQDLRHGAMLFQHSVPPESTPGPDDDDDDQAYGADGLHTSRDPAYTPYPLFFSRYYGHWQANALITPLRTLVRKFARTLAVFPDGPPCIEGIKSQCYNSLTHSVRHSSSTHLAQRGPLTGASAGAWASTPPNRNTARRLVHQAQAHFPHAQLAQQLEQGQQNPFLRLENVVTFHFSRMKEHLHPGDTFYKEVIFPLVDLCSHPTVFTALKNATVIIKPMVSSSTLSLTVSPPSADPRSRSYPPLLNPLTQLDPHRYMPTSISGSHTPLPLSSRSSGHTGSTRLSLTTAHLTQSTWSLLRSPNELWRMHTLAPPRFSLVPSCGSSGSPADCWIMAGLAFGLISSSAHSTRFQSIRYNHGRASPFQASPWLPLLAPNSSRTGTHTSSYVLLYPVHSLSTPP